METKSEINIQLTERFYNTQRYDPSFILTINGHDTLIDASEEDLTSVKDNLERAIPASQGLDNGWIYEYSDPCKNIHIALPANRLSEAVSAITLALTISDKDRGIVEKSNRVDQGAREDECVISCSRMVNDGRTSPPALALAAAFDLDDMTLSQLATLAKFLTHVSQIYSHLTESKIVLLKNTVNGPTGPFTVDFRTLKDYANR